jgi:hypothetical protein
MCTPVIFVRDGQVLERTYEYTPVLVIRDADPETLLNPGIFVSYTFVPYTVTVVHRPRSLASFIATTIGVLAGGFAIASWLDRWLYADSNQKMLE